MTQRQLKCTSHELNGQNIFVGMHPTNIAKKICTDSLKRKTHEVNITLEEVEQSSQPFFGKIYHYIGKKIVFRKPESYVVNGKRYCRNYRIEVKKT